MSRVAVTLPDDFIDALADALAERLRATSPAEDMWMDTQTAAEYLGIHRDTLRKHAARGAIPYQQAGEGAKLFFWRSDLDAWRAAGGRLQ